MSIEVMIDIETLDTAATAVIFQVAAVSFNSADGHIDGATCIDLDAQVQIGNGRTVSASTIGFWLNPEISGAAHTSFNSEVKKSVHALYQSLKLACEGADAIWAKGSFDFELLENLLRDYGYEVPWKYCQPRDLRTMMKECGVEKQKFVSHNALDDCKHQIKQLMECREVLKPASDCSVCDE